MTEGNRPVTLDDLKFIFESNDPITEHLESEDVKRLREQILDRIAKLLHGQRILDDLERMS